MGKRLFGTDGIRGKAGAYPLDRRTAEEVGAALGRWARRRVAAPAVLIGMDPRESSPWLASQLASGLTREGTAVRFAGLVTTPGVAYLTRTGDFVAGVMISASHNPYEDNGIKVFDHSGFKLPDDQETLLEDDILASLHGPASEPTSLEVDEGLDAQYLDYLASSTEVSLAGLRLVVDCAHGAASHLGPELFRRLGATVEPVGCDPDGRNINAGVGALHVDHVRREVLARHADAGVALDGDADRAMLVSRSGKIIDGDHMLLLAARSLHAQGRLTSRAGTPVVIATVMSNLGLERALAADGIALVRTAVGDKYVLEEMERRGAVLGGEQSGHVIFRTHATTGDGLLTALRVLETVQREGRDLDALTADLQVYPQLLLNVRVGERRPLQDLPTVQAAIQHAESSLGDRGRILVRFSGTEPLARVMVEGQEEAEVRTLAEGIAHTLREALGAAPAAR